MTEPAAKAAPDQRVPVKTADGRYGTVLAKDVGQVVDQGGKVASANEFAANQRAINLEAKYGGTFEGTAGPAAAGFARGATMGVSDLLAVKGVGAIDAGAGESIRQRLNEYNEYAPITSKASEVAGFLAPLIASAGASAPEQAAGRGVARSVAGGLPGLTARAGAGTAGLVTEALGGTAGRGLLARTAIKGAALAAGGSVEGGLYGIGSELSEASLGNHELAAQKLWAAAKGGAVWGGIGGGLLGAGGELVGSGLKAAAAKSFSVKGGTLAETLENTAGELTLQRAGIDKAGVKRLDQWYRGGHEAAGRLVADEVPSLVGKRSVGEMTSRELWQEGAQKLKQVSGAAMDNVLDTAQASARPIRALEVMDEMRQTANSLRTGIENIGKEGIVRQMDGFVERFGRESGVLDASGRFANPNATVSLKDLHNLRQAADDLWTGNKINPNATPLKGLRDTVSQKLATEIEAAGGAEASQAWQAANQRYQVGKALERAAANASAKAGANQFLSLTDKMASATGGMIGSGIGTAIGGPVGAAIGGAIGAGVTGLASKWARSTGVGLAIDAMRGTARLAAAKELMGGIDRQIGDGVRGFLETGGRAALADSIYRGRMPQASKVGTVSREEYERVAEQVGQLRAQQKAGVSHVDNFDELAKVAPNVVAGLSQAHARGVAYLHATMPPARIDPNALNIPGSMYVPKGLSPQELKWLRCVEAVKDPMGVIRDLKAGHVSHEAVDALKSVYPALYEHVRSSVKEQAVKRGKPLSVEQASALGILLGEPVHYTQRPEFVAAMQASKGAPAPDETEQAEPQGPRGKPDIEGGADKAETPQDALAQ